MFNIYYDSEEYKGDIVKIDSQEGYGLGMDVSTLGKSIKGIPERIQRVMFMHKINLTLEECAGLYHSWSTTKYAAVWKNSTCDMTDDELYTTMRQWLIEVLPDNYDRLNNIVKEIFAVNA